MQKKHRGTFTTSLKRFKQEEAVAPPLGVYDPKLNLTKRRVKNCIIKPSKNRLKSVLRGLGIKAKPNDLRGINSELNSILRKDLLRKGSMSKTTSQKFKSTTVGEFNGLIPYSRKMHKTLVVISIEIDNIVT